jgi:hypothetical protein
MIYYRRRFYSASVALAVIHCHKFIEAIFSNVMTLPRWPCFAVEPILFFGFVWVIVVILNHVVRMATLTLMPSTVPRL